MYIYKVRSIGVWSGQKRDINPASLELTEIAIRNGRNGALRVENSCAQFLSQ